MTDHSSSELLIHVDNITGGYIPDVDILNSCSLEVAPGELIGIIGPNGAGKSTLLKSLFGLVKIRLGKVIYAGDDITNFKAHALVERGIARDRLQVVGAGEGLAGVGPLRQVTFTVIVRDGD